MRPLAPEAATAIRTQVLGAPTYGDIDEDGDSDVVLFLAQGPGGSGPLEPDDLLRADERALWLGHRVRPIAEAVRHPNAPYALKVVLKLALLRPGSGLAGGAAARR